MTTEYTFVTQWHTFYSKLSQLALTAPDQHVARTVTRGVYDFLLRASGEYQRLRAPSAIGSSPNSCSRDWFIWLEWSVPGGKGPMYTAWFYSNGSVRFAYSEVDDRGVTVRGSHSGDEAQAPETVPIEELAVFAGEIR